MSKPNRDGTPRYPGYEELALAEGYVWGYIHNLAYEGVWHITVASYRQTLCEMGWGLANTSPGVHVDFTEPDIGVICTHCLSIKNGGLVGVPFAWRQRHPNAYSAFLKHGHWYQCVWRKTPKGKACGWYFYYTTPEESRICHHTGTDYKMRHLCCDRGKPKSDRTRWDAEEDTLVRQLWRRLHAAKSRKIPYGLPSDDLLEGV